MDLRPLHLPLTLVVGAAALTASAGSGAAAATAGWSFAVALGIAAVALAGAAAASAARILRAHVRAANDQRRRAARELHDGAAQDLAFLVTRAKILASSRPDVEGLHQLEAAAQRALDEIRTSIGALTRDDAPTLAAAVAAAAEEVAHTEGVRVQLELDASIEVSPKIRDAIVRIVREAARNAVRHGRANVVRVTLRDGDRIRLSVVDDGVGFQVDDISADGQFGIVSMSERARALGGDVRIASEPGAGTRVEVAVP